MAWARMHHLSCTSTQQKQEMREKQMLKAFHLASSRESKEWKNIATRYS
jgi:hypothetical protein